MKLIRTNPRKKGFLRSSSLLHHFFIGASPPPFNSASGEGSRAKSMADNDIVDGGAASSAQLLDSGTDNARGVGRLSQDILPHLLNLYNCKSLPSDYDIYASNATFEDPLMRASGVKQIKSAFYATPKVFTEGRMGEYHVQEHETSSGAGEIKIDNIQHYRILGKQIDMRSLIKLQVENGKIVRHEDLWEKRPLWNRQSVKVPLVGRFAEVLRKGNMLFTHALMGFGKDPKVKVSH